MKFFYIIVLIFILLSCSKEIEIDIPRTKPQLVVYSTIVPFTIPKPKFLRLSLQTSKHIFDTSTTYINYAKVLFYENNTLKDTLKYNDSLRYYIISENDYPVAGNNYSIKIIKKGFDTVTANTTIPNKVNIIDTNITPIAFFDDLGSVFSEVSITFNDPPNEENYYEIAISDIAFSYENYDYFYDLTTNDNIITSESYYPSLIRFDVDKPKFLLFTDKQINGQKYTVNVYYTPPQRISEYRYISKHYISVHLRNVTKEYYKFKTTMIQQSYSKTEDILYGMGEPLNVISNINNGYGLFSGFNNDIVSFHIDSVKLH